MTSCTPWCSEPVRPVTLRWPSGGHCRGGPLSLSTHEEFHVMVCLNREMLHATRDCTSPVFGCWRGPYSGQNKLMHLRYYRLRASASASAASIAQQACIEQPACRKYLARLPHDLTHCTLDLATASRSYLPHLESRILDLTHWILS